MGRAPNIGDDQSSTPHAMKCSCTVLQSFNAELSIVQDPRGDIFEWYRGIGCAVDM
jgi:hypothetical protein